MTTISGLGAPPGTTRASVRPGGGGFAVPAAEARGPGAGGAAAAVPGLLAMQEAMQAGLTDPDAQRDRAARRHAAALLEALAELQRAMLDGGGEGALQRLAGLLRAAPAPADPLLAQAQRAILVRAAVELARRPGAAARSCGNAVTPENPSATDI